MMGEKDRARAEMAAAGLPIIPGSAGVVADEAAAKKVAAEIGFPLMIKAVEGGGGRGMRMVRTKKELIPAFQTARTEARTGFRQPERLHGKADRAPPAHRISGARRQARQRDPSRRARMLASAPPSESAGGISLDRCWTRRRANASASRSSRRCARSAIRAPARSNSCAMHPENFTSSR